MIKLSYEIIRDLCIDFAKNQKEKDMYYIAISRGGITAAHIISQYLKVDLLYYIPDVTDINSFPKDKPLCFIDDTISPEGRTYRKLFNLLMDREWYIYVLLQDGQSLLDNKNIYYGIKSNIWINFPWRPNDTDITIESKGRFRDGTDNYGV